MRVQDGYKFNLQLNCFTSFALLTISMYENIIYVIMKGPCGDIGSDRIDPEYLMICKGMPTLTGRH